jgi:hypothetical protein
MTARVRRLPFSLDPLIAEAKRRARRRRLVTATLLLVLAGGAGGAALGLSGATSPHGAGVALSPAKAKLPPLSGLAARKALCGSPYILGCHSPDGAWSIKVLNHGFGCTVTVYRLDGGRRAWAYQSHDGGCDPPIWLRPHLLVFRHDENHPAAADLLSLDPATRKVTLLARFTGYVVSPDERWIAGEADAREDGTARLVAVMSLTNGTCRVVTRATSPGQDVSVDESPWSIRPPLPTAKPFRDPVVWRTVHEGGTTIRVVAGPGTGFTRNSRGVIVAEWQPSRTAPYATHKRLVKFSLSSLQTSCPSGLAPGG